jgi:hypothetical protein
MEENRDYAMKYLKSINLRSYAKGTCLLELQERNMLPCNIRVTTEDLGDLLRVIKEQLPQEEFAEVVSYAYRIPEVTG